MADLTRFQYFSEVPSPVGADGWEQMYPYFLRPNPDLAEDENTRFWFPDTIHWGRACYPFDSIGAEAVYLGAGQNSARIYAIPTARGLELRVLNGYVYVSGTPVTDPAEIEERVAIFQERAGHYFENWDSIYQEWKDKIAVLVERMERVSFPILPKYEPAESVFEHQGRSMSWSIIENYNTLINEFFVLWQHHFEMINLGYGGFLTFFQFCKSMWPNIADQTVSQMVSGIDIVAFKPDNELRALAIAAVENGLAGHFSTGRSYLDIVNDLDASDEGKTWLSQYEAVSRPWFNYFSDYGFSHRDRTWLDDPQLAYDGIIRYIDRLHTGEDLTRPIEQIQADRERIVSGYRDLLGGAEQEQFDSLLALARNVYPHIEEHNIYVEHWGHAVFWRKVRELADFLVQMDFLSDPSDIYYLNRFELDQILFDVVQSWAIGVPARGTLHWGREIEKRRGIMKVLRATSAAPAIGTPPDEVTDPLAVMNYGVTTALVREWLSGVSSEESGFNGIAASPGTAEGTVRVLMTEEDLYLFQPGEVLVAPITAPAWSAVFSSAAAVVTDSGGMMSHAAIVCREYDLPAVVGTGFATTKLQTGQRVRVDGATGRVDVLEPVTS